MSKAQQLSLAEEDAIVRTRFLTQTSVPRGQPPLRTLTKKFLALVELAGKPASADAVDRAHRELLRELTMVELQAHKFRAICEANTQEQQMYLRKQKDVEVSIEQAKQDIESRKLDLKEAEVYRGNQEKYEAIRDNVMEHPSRAVTQQEIDRLQREIQKLKADEVRANQVLERRRKQFALLFHVIEELQRTCDDPLDEATDGLVLGEAGSAPQRADAMETD